MINEEITKRIEALDDLKFVVHLLIKYKQLDNIDIPSFCLTLTNEKMSSEVLDVIGTGSTFFDEKVKAKYQKELIEKL